MSEIRHAFVGVPIWAMLSAADTMRCMHRTPSLSPRSFALFFAATAVLAAPSAASAATYCVADTACAAAGGSGKPSLLHALAVAGSTPEADVVRLGPGTFTGNVDYLASSPVSIVGAGRDQTILKANAKGAPNYPRILKLASPAGTANLVSDLTLDLDGVGARGLEVSNGATARRIDIVGAPEHAFGLMASGSASLAEDITIDLEGDGNLGVYLDADAGVLQRATVAAESGVFASGGKSGTAVSSVRGVRITPGRVGLEVAGGLAQAESVLVDVRGVPNARGLLLQSLQGYAKRRLYGRHLTVVGSPSFGEARGLLVESADAQRTAQFELSESLIVGFSTAVELKSSNGGWATGIMRNSYHGAFLHSNKPNGQGGLSDVAPVQLYGEVGFTDPSHGDFSLRASSPLVDAGSADKFLDLDSPLDVTGAPRVTDGDGDGTARRDVGAFERPAPTPSTGDPKAGTPQGDLPVVLPEAPTTTQPEPTEPKAVPADTLAPRLSNLRVTKDGRGKRATHTIRFVTDEASTVTITLARRVGKRWRALKGTLSLAATGGQTKLVLPKKLGGKTLKPGILRLSATARDAAGNTAKTQEVTFRRP